MQPFITVSLATTIVVSLCTLLGDCAPANSSTAQPAPASATNGNSSVILGALTNSAKENATEERGSRLLGYGVGLTVGPQNVPVGPGVVGGSCTPPFIGGFPPAYCYTGYGLGLGYPYGYPYSAYYLG